MWENCYYIAGDDDGVLDTPVGPVGVALCAEMFRSRTVRRMVERVGLVLAASCWWTVPEGGPEAGAFFDRNNRDLLRQAPSEIARALGVPVIHASQAGEFEAYNFPGEATPYRSHYLGETQIVDASGEVLARMADEDGEGVILADIEAGSLWMPTAPIPERHWIRPLPRWFDAKWMREGTLGAEYYRSTTQPRLSAQTPGNAVPLSE
jgi:predicted amidohydrolase